MWSHNVSNWTCRGDDGFPGAHPGPAVGHLPVEVSAEMQQQIESAAAGLQAQTLGQDGLTDAQTAAAVAAAAAAAGADGQSAQVGADPAGADVAAAAAAAAQLAQLNAEQAQTNAVQAQLTAEQAQQQVDAMQAQQVDAMHLAAQQFNLDAAQVAALSSLPVSGGLTLDAAQAAALQGLNIAQLAMPGLMDPNGQHMIMSDGLQLQAAHAELYAQQHAPEEFGKQQ